MEQRQFDRVETSTETLFGSRRSLDFRSAPEQENVGRAREMLNLSNPATAVNDNRREALRTLFPDREVEPDQSYFETAPVTEKEPRKVEERANRLFVTGTDFETVAANRYESPIYDPDLAPSAKTMQYASRAKETAFEFEPAVRREEQTAVAHKPLSRKGKLAVAIYSGVIVVVAALIVLTGALIGNVSSDVARMESEVVSRQVYLNSVNQTLDKVSDLESSAGNLGMARPDGGVQMELLPVVGAGQAKAQSSGFDRFCDWLSRVFG